MEPGALSSSLSPPLEDHEQVHQAFKSMLQIKVEQGDNGVQGTSNRLGNNCIPLQHTRTQQETGSIQQTPAEFEPPAQPSRGGAGTVRQPNGLVTGYIAGDAVSPAVLPFPLPNVTSTSLQSPPPFSMPVPITAQGIQHSLQKNIAPPPSIPSSNSNPLPFIPPSSLPSFPSASTSSTSSAFSSRSTPTVTATRTSVVLPFPSSILSANERSSPPPFPPMQSVPFTGFGHPSKEVSPFVTSNRSAMRQHAGVAGGEGGGLKVGNGKRKGGELSRERSEISSTGDEEEVVLVRPPSKNANGRRKGGLQASHEPPEPRVARARRSTSTMTHVGGETSSHTESDEEEGEEMDQGSDEEEVSRLRKRRRVETGNGDQDDEDEDSEMDEGSEEDGSRDRAATAVEVDRAGRAPQDELVVPKQNGTELPEGWFLQTFKCTKAMSKKWKANGATTAKTLELAASAQMCPPCRGRITGYVCIFENFRAYRQLPDGSFDLRPTYLRNEPDVLPRFPEGPEFNAPFTQSEAKLLKSIAADKLGPTMKKEVEHASQASCSRISRDVTVINNCDTCLHVILCGSWICHVCAREVCFDCYSTLIALEEQNRRSGGGGGRGQDQSLALEGVSTATLTTLVKCGKIPHKSSNFAPLTRIDLDRLKSTAQEMEDWRKTHPVQPAKELPQGWIDRFYHQPHEEENSHPYLKLPSNLLPPTQDQYVTALPNALPPALPGDDPLDALLSPPPSIATLPEGFSTFDFFQSVWSRGEAMVVDIDLSEVSSIDWSPEYFIEKFGSHKVTIGSNLPGGRDKKETVGSFFSRFGRGSRSNTSDKIKDWPPSTDFRQDFPELWQDFNQMLPIGAVTRRDGVLNISTHTPGNANPPDLGPKGYFSEVSDDTPGGLGSTKLHTVNVLLWSSTGPQQATGIAVWDLYRAEDADKIREFLYELIAEKDYNGDVAKARMDQDDPIHTQRFFLDQKLRKELWEKKGVKSWRIHQKPSQVVFVPAGCAHQVCNFSDCIKVASDFVSIENVGRCWKVTDEFRQQTKEDKLWKSDILGLKCQLLWAWESAKRLDSD